MSEAFFEIVNLHKYFGGVIATDNVNIKVEKGQIYGIIGPNGAGKTTLFNMITGVYPPDSGEIYLEGQRIDGKQTHEIANLGIARTFQNIRLFSELTCYENLITFCQKNINYSLLDGIFRTKKCRDQEKQMETLCIDYLNEVGLSEQADILSKNLPYGMQRRLEIARAMVTRPKILLLDEPAAGMNEEESFELTNIIKNLRDNYDVTIIIIDHHMDVIMDVCDRITAINFGKPLATGTVQEIQQNSEVIEAYLGVDENA